jgi:hypothetical protein
LSTHRQRAPFRAIISINYHWCRLQESNPRPTDYKSVALPTGRPGIVPRCPGPPRLRRPARSREVIAAAAPLHRTLGGRLLRHAGIFMKIFGIFLVKWEPQEYPKTLAKATFPSTIVRRGWGWVKSLRRLLSPHSSSSGRWPVGRRSICFFVSSSALDYTVLGEHALNLRRRPSSATAGRADTFLAQSSSDAVERRHTSRLQFGNYGGKIGRLCGRLGPPGGQGGQPSDTVRCRPAPIPAEPPALGLGGCKRFAGTLRNGFGFVFGNSGHDVHR